jgi:hypothetical protein
MSQLHDDLNKRINQRLRTWVADSVELYRMADLHPRDAFVDVFAALLTVTAGAIVVFDLDEAETIKHLKNTIARERKLDEKRKTRHES